MGFFTELHIDKKILELSDKEYKAIPEKMTWQTKSFGREILDAYLYENNKLCERRPKFEIDIEEMKKVGFEEYFKEREQIGYRFVTIHFDGIANFYNRFGDLWIEFEAEFYDGILLKIRRITK